MARRDWLLVLGLGVVITGCPHEPVPYDSDILLLRIDAGPRPDAWSAPPDAWMWPDTPVVVPPIDTGTPDGGALWPTDRDAYVGADRAARPSLTPPTLLVDPSGLDATVVDPEMALVHRVDVTTHTVTTVALPEGSTPGRAVYDPSGVLHVVLTAAGAVASIARDATVRIRAVCAAPRGIAVTEDAIVVACAEGVLSLLLLDRDAPAVAVPVADDLDDVSYFGGRTVQVTRRRAAEVLTFDLATRSIVGRFRPEDWLVPDPLAPVEADGSVPLAHYVPRMAMRLHDGWLLHRMERTTPVPAHAVAAHGSSYAPLPSTSAVGCTSIVRTALTAIPTPYWPDGPQRALPVADAIDFATGSEGRYVVTSADRAILVGPGASCDESTPHPLGGTIAALAVVGETLYLVTRYPLALVIASRGHEERIALAARAVAGTSGRDLFTTVSPSGVSCTTCHPDGGDDGHVWTHLPGPPLRTIAIRGHVLDTAPFHWEGDLADFHALVGEVWVGRMGAAPLDATREAVLADFVAGLDALPAPTEDVEAVVRGAALFTSAEVGCADCHAGASYTDDSMQDVGTGGPFQVPTLVGTVYRAPYFHDGCAATLRERFTGDASCTGGDAHGHTSSLSEGEIDDLVAFLRTI